MFIFLLAPLLGARAAYAEEPAPVVPPALTAQVAPDYPAEALAERLSGDVVVLVTVGEDGRPREVQHLRGGPAVFVGPALDAAKALVFTPATRDGTPVAVRVPVHFHFAPPEEVLEEEPEVLVVQAVRDPTLHETHAVTVVDAAALERVAGDDLAETLSEVPGVAMGRSAGDTTKPIVRGHQERRILVLLDGVRHESQKWGLDHATEIDPLGAGSVHVVKGAAGVRYGPDAIGGVVLVEPLPLRSEPGVGGRVQVLGEDNGLRGVVAARVDGASSRVDGLAWRAEGNWGAGGDLRTPRYVLANTGSVVWNAGLTVGRAHDGWESTVAWNHHDLRAGVTWAARAGTPEELRAGLARDVPLGAETWVARRDIARPWQEVTHDVARARVRRQLDGGGEAEATYAFQLNHRTEYDYARRAVEGPQFDFTLRTHSLASKWTDRTRESAWGRLHGEVGGTGTFQENVYRGQPLIPNFRALQGGVHASERIESGPVTVEVGGRLDALDRTAFLTRSAWQRAQARGALGVDDCVLGDDAARCPVRYTAGSLSLGGAWVVIPERLDVRVDLSSATRFPNVDELYMSGAAPTSPVVAVGDAGLGPETTRGVSPTVGVHAPLVDVELSGYVNRIDDYILFAPDIGESGVPAVDVTIQGAFPRYRFHATDAWFWGADGGVRIAPSSPVSLSVQGALVRATDASTGTFLPMVPPDRVRVGIESNPGRVGALEELRAAVSVEHVLAQSRADASADFAPPPDAYTLLEADLGGRMAVGGRTVSVGLVGRNLLDSVYRDYSSLLRYQADEPGRSVRLRIGADF